MNPDTICAPATPPGAGAVAIVRVSGPQAFAVVDAVTVKTTPCAAQRGHTLRRARVVDRNGQTVDDVLLAVFHAPRSFTGEDCVEVHAHGGPVVVRRVLEELYAAGARPARPGEFSERAFVNGKMDLAQAEAVADIIAAETDTALLLAQRQNAGELSSAVRGVRELTLSVLARIEAAIDFPEDVGELDIDACVSDLDAAVDSVDALLQTARRGMVTRSGLSLVLVGRPNVGKSSLLNALVGRARAIVSAVPGTTRDTVEDVFILRGIAVRATDTAGLRDTSDAVEQEGVRRSRAALAQADLAVLVLDASAGMTDIDRALFAEVGARPHLIVWNKWDLVMQDNAGGHLLHAVGEPLCLSAATGWNLPALEDAIAEAVGAGTAVPSNGAVVTHARHQNALETAQNALTNARHTLLSGLPVDFASGDVRAAIDALGAVTGETASADVMGEIFSRFCIGK